jgi:hypothetical protein
MKFRAWFDIGLVFKPEPYLKFSFANSLTDGRETLLYIDNNSSTILLLVSWTLIIIPSLAFGKVVHTSKRIFPLLAIALFVGIVLFIYLCRIGRQCYEPYFLLAKGEVFQASSEEAVMRTI